MELPKYFYFRVYAGNTSVEVVDASDADVVEVVRCRDCKYCIKEDVDYWCNGFCSPARLVNGNDYCSHGK